MELQHFQSATKLAAATTSTINDNSNVAALAMISNFGYDKLYGYYDNVKRLFIMALESNDRTTISILLSGPPVSAKTLFLQSLMKLQDSHFIDCSNATKSGLVDYIFDNKAKYLLLDELDKLSTKIFLLNLMEAGIIRETR
jgi:hypothetical protein